MRCAQRLGEGTREESDLVVRLVQMCRLAFEDLQEGVHMKERGDGSEGSGVGDAGNF